MNTTDLQQLAASYAAELAPYLRLTASQHDNVRDAVIAAMEVLRDTTNRQLVLSGSGGGGQTVSMPPEHLNLFDCYDDLRAS